MKKLLLISLLFTIMLSLGVLGSTQVVVNSEDWQDVYNGMIFANIKGYKSSFVIDYDQGIELINLIDPLTKDVILVQSEDETVPVMASQLKSKGFNVEIIQGTTTENNLILAERSGVNNFIALDKAFGHNAIAIGGYCSASKSMPLFVDRKNVDDVSSFLEDIQNPAVTIYGRVEREAKEGLEDFVIEEINEGDKFANNLVILKKHLKLPTRKQLILTNGNFIEQEILSGLDPVVLVGNTNVPEEVIQAIKDSDVKVGVAVGTGIVGNAQTIKNEAGLKIFVKFAQGRNEQQMPLDMFEIPRYSFSLNIKDASYNKATKKLELTFTNEGENYLIFKGNYELFVGEERIEVFADEESQLLSSESEFTKLYDIDLSEHLNEDIILSSNVLMGESEKAFENILKKEQPILFVEFKDNSDVEVLDLKYNKGTKRFEITIKNNVDNDVYVRTEVVDLIIDEEEETISSDKLKLSGLQEKVFKIKAILESVDIADNEQVYLKTYYGERENALVKVDENEFDMKVKSALISIMIFVVVIILIAIALLFMFKRRDKDYDKVKVSKKVKAKTPVKKKATKKTSKKK